VACNGIKRNESLYFLYYGDRTDILLKNNNDAYSDSLLLISKPSVYTIDSHDHKTILNRLDSVYKFNESPDHAKGILLIHFIGNEVANKYLFKYGNGMNTLTSIVEGSLSDVELKSKIIDWIQRIQKLHNEAMSNTDTIIHIKLEDGISFNWNNKTSQIVEDSLFRSIVSRFENIKLKLSDQITNLSITPARTCGLERNLYVGDLVFMIITRIQDIPNPVQMQLDVFEMNCRYPAGFFEAIGYDRTGIRERVKQSLIHPQR